MNARFSFASLFILLSVLAASSLFGQSAAVPADYQLLYEQDFEEKAKLSDFEMTDPSAWKIHEVDGNQVLELVGKSDYQPRVRSPFNIAFLKAHQVGDFVLEVKLAQTGREYGHRDMCLFYNIKDASNFYYTHIASVADPHAHNIFLVNDAPRVAIATKTTEGANWGKTGEWHTIRVVRKVEEGSIRIYFDDMETPIMEATDTHFVQGFIGFGSFDDTGRIDDIKIWGPQPVVPKFGFFK